VFRCERVRLRAFQVQNADQAILYEERNDELRANGHTVSTSQARKRGSLSVSETRTARRSPAAAPVSLGEGNAHARLDGVTIAHNEGALKMLRLFIHSMTLKT